MYLWSTGSGSTSAAMCRSYGMLLTLSVLPRMEKGRKRSVDIPDEEPGFQTAVVTTLA